MNIKLYNEDCLKIMDQLIEEGVKVDAVICDPPYGTTACKWDNIIPFEEMWSRLEKLSKPNTAIILFSSQPFTAKVINSNSKLFRYEYIWEKSRATNFLNAKKMPLKKHENILVFYKKLCTYNPQGLIEVNETVKPSAKRIGGLYPGISQSGYNKKHTNYPHSILKFKSVGKTVHPTQKPLDLLEFLIKTYTHEGDIVLDFTMGSGTTGRAAKNCNRDFIGIELDKKYFQIAKDIIDK